jgi:hypothetical protein
VLKIFERNFVTFGAHAPIFPNVPNKYLNNFKKLGLMTIFKMGPKIIEIFFPKIVL